MVLAALALCTACCAPMFGSHPEVTPLHDSEVARLVAQLGNPKSGLHPPYCTPENNPAVDAAYDRLLRIGKTAVPGLIAGLKSPNKYVRAHCAGLLGEIGDARAVDRLDALVVKDTDIRSWVITALGQLRDPRSVDSLMAVLPDGTGIIDSLPAQVPADGLQAAEALARIGQPAIPSLERALGSSNECVRANAQHALDRIRAQGRVDAHPSE